MSNLLVVNSSLFSQQGQSSQLTAYFTECWLQANPQGKVVSREVLPETFPHLSAERFGAFLSSEPTAVQQDVIDFSDELLAEIKAADHIVIGMPMYNFGIPSAFKAYVDHIARAGVSFKYTEQGPVGLLEDKPVTILCSRGGLYQGTDNDVQTPYIRLVLQFLGLKSCQFIYAEGLNMGEEAQQKSLADARQSISALF